MYTIPEGRKTGTSLRLITSVEVEVLHLVKFRDGVAHIPWCYDMIQAVKQEKIRERKHTRKVKKIRLSEVQIISVPYRENFLEGEMSSEESDMVLTERIQEIKEDEAPERGIKDAEENDPFVEKDEVQEEKEVKEEIGQLIDSLQSNKVSKFFWPSECLVFPVPRRRWLARRFGFRPAQKEDRRGGRHLRRQTQERTDRQVSQEG